MSNDQEQSKVRNPVSGAMAYGLGGAAIAATGAAIRDNAVHNEAMTILVGGVITGAIAGSVGCCVPQTNESSNLCLRLGLGVLDLGLNVAAFLSAPTMGELVMDLDVPWGRVLVDELIGSATLTGGVLGVAATVGISYGAYKCAQHCCSSNFFTPAANTISKPTVQLPAIDLEAPISTTSVTVNNL